MAQDRGDAGRMTGQSGTEPHQYPGAPDDPADQSARIRRDAERCHILPAKSGKRVMTQGVFDILHLGHLHYFQAAKALGDELVVIIARDATVARNKHAPIFSEDARREMVQALAPVDHAVLGHRGDFYRVVEELKPDVICIGYDQPYKVEAIKTECARRGLEVEVVRLQHMDYDLDSTRKVVEAIADRLATNDLYGRADTPAQDKVPPPSSRDDAAADRRAEDKVNEPAPSKSSQRNGTLATPTPATTNPATTNPATAPPATTNPATAPPAKPAPAKGTPREAKA